MAGRLGYGRRSRNSPASARVKRKQFELEATRLLNELDAVPSDTALSGKRTSRLEVLASADVQAVLKEIEQGASSGSEEDDTGDGPRTVVRS